MPGGRPIRRVGVGKIVPAPPNGKWTPGSPELTNFERAILGEDDDDVIFAPEASA